MLTDVTSYMNRRKLHDLLEELGLSFPSQHAVKLPANAAI